MSEVRPLMLKCPKCGNQSVETPIDQSDLEFMVKCGVCGKEFGRWEQVQAAFVSKSRSG